MRGLAALALLGGVCHSGKLLLPPLLLAILILAMLLHVSLLNQLRTPDYHCGHRAIFDSPIVLSVSKMEPDTRSFCS